MATDDFHSCGIWSAKTIRLMNVASHSDSKITPRHVSDYLKKKK